MLRLSWIGTKGSRINQENHPNTIISTLPNFPVGRMHSGGRHSPSRWQTQNSPSEQYMLNLASALKPVFTDLRSTDDVPCTTLAEQRGFFWGLKSYGHQHTMQIKQIIFLVDDNTSRNSCRICTIVWMWFFRIIQGNVRLCLSPSFVGLLTVDIFWQS